MQGVGRAARKGSLEGRTGGSAWHTWMAQIAHVEVLARTSTPSCPSTDHCYGQRPHKSQQTTKGGHAALVGIEEDASKGHEQDHVARRRASAVSVSQEAFWRELARSLPARVRSKTRSSPSGVVFARGGHG